MCVLIILTLLCFFKIIICITTIYRIYSKTPWSMPGISKFLSCTLLLKRYLQDSTIVATKGEDGGEEGEEEEGEGEGEEEVC